MTCFDQSIQLVLLSLFMTVPVCLSLLHRCMYCYFVYRLNLLFPGTLVPGFSLSVSTSNTTFRSSVVVNVFSSSNPPPQITGYTAQLQKVGSREIETKSILVEHKQGRPSPAAQITFQDRALPSAKYNVRVRFDTERGRPFSNYSAITTPDTSEYYVQVVQL